MNPVYKELLLAVVRHAMTAAGPAIIGAEAATAETLPALVNQTEVWVSTTITLAGLLWSFVRKWRRA